MDVILDDSDFIMRDAEPVLKIGDERAMFAEMRSLPEGSERRLEIREYLVRANFSLAISASYRSRAQNVDYGDRLSEALLTLTRCVDKFDHRTGVKFGTYAMRAMINTFTRIGVRENKHSHAPMEAADWHPTPEPACEELEALREVLVKNTANLTTLEDRLVRARYGMTDGRVRKYEELGRMAGCGKERARQIVAEATKKIAQVL